MSGCNISVGQNRTSDFNQAVPQDHDITSNGIIGQANPEGGCGVVGDTGSVESTIGDKDGRPRWVQWHALVRDNRQQRLRHGGAVSRDGVGPQNIDTLNQGNAGKAESALRIGRHATNQLIGACATISVDPDRGVRRHIALHPNSRAPDIDRAVIRVAHESIGTRQCH